MVDYDSNVYYHPEKHGLVAVAEHDFSSGSYEFDIRAVWKTKDGKKLYTARDSGCSCPSPFEDYAGVPSLERLTSLTALKAEYRDALKAGHYSLSGWDEFKSKVAEALRASR